MADFPTLSKNANRVNFQQRLSVDPSLVSKFENGAQQTRSKFTNVALKFNLSYSFLTEEDKELLEDFEREVGYRAGSFNWIDLSTNPNKTYIVRFDKNLLFTQEQKRDLWNIVIDVNIFVTDVIKTIKIYQKILLFSILS